MRMTSTERFLVLTPYEQRHSPERLAFWPWEVIDFEYVNSQAVFVIRRYQERDAVEHTITVMGPLGEFGEVGLLEGPISGLMGMQWIGELEARILVEQEMKQLTAVDCREPFMRRIQ